MGLVWGWGLGLGLGLGWRWDRDGDGDGVWWTFRLGFFFFVARANNPALCLDKIRNAARRIGRE